MGKISEEEKKKRLRKRRKNSHLTKDEWKAKRRRARRRIVIIQRICMVFLLLTVVGGGSFAVIWNLPSVKLSRQLDKGKEYEEEAAYEDAIQSYEKALQIDSTSVKAYQCMAVTYLDMDDEQGAKKILFEGWENTQDESLLQYYCTVVLNEAVNDINKNNCTLETVEKVVSVLEKDTDNKDALEIIHTAYERLMAELADGGGEDFFLDVDEASENCSFESYEQLMNRLFALYQANGTEEIKNIVSEYGMIGLDRMKVSRHHLDAWKQILAQIEEISPVESRSNLLSCLKKEEEIQDIFSDIFTEFDAGNYEAAKDFIVSDTYTQIRDSFIGKTMEFWNGETMIPVSRECVILEQQDGQWIFSYPDFKDNEKTAGVITVWGNKMTDNGVQRSCISYEPAEESGSYYPHTEYVISYMFSNVQKKNSFTEIMNYHLETRTWTETDMVTHMIGDWGGPYQWEKEY